MNIRLQPGAVGRARGGGDAARPARARFAASAASPPSRAPAWSCPVSSCACRRHPITETARRTHVPHQGNRSDPVKHVGSEFERIAPKGRPGAKPGPDLERGPRGTGETRRLPPAVANGRGHRPRVVGVRALGGQPAHDAGGAGARLQPEAARRSGQASSVRRSRVKSRRPAGLQRSPLQTCDSVRMTAGDQRDVRSSARLHLDAHARQSPRAPDPETTSRQEPPAAGRRVRRALTWPPGALAVGRGRVPPRRLARRLSRRGAPVGGLRRARAPRRVGVGGRLAVAALGSSVIAMTSASASVAPRTTAPPAGARTCGRPARRRPARRPRPLGRPRCRAVSVGTPARRRRSGCASSGRRPARPARRASSSRVAPGPPARAARRQRSGAAPPTAGRAAAAHRQRDRRVPNATRVDVSIAACVRKAGPAATALGDRRARGAGHRRVHGQDDQPRDKDTPSLSLRHAADGRRSWRRTPARTTRP